LVKELRSLGNSPSVTGFSSFRTVAAQHPRGWEERRQAIAQAAGLTRDLLTRHGIPRPTITGAGTLEFEATSGVYTELQCGSYIFMDADHGRNPRRRPDPGLRAEPIRLGDGDEPPDRGPRHRRRRPQGARLRLRPAAGLRRA
jgi:hypothetical protein